MSLEDGAVPIGVSLSRLEDMLENNVGRIYCGRSGSGICGYQWADLPPVTSPPARDMVNHPEHYNAHPSGVECIEICEHMTFNLGNAFKYGWRYREKGDPVENLKKMLWYAKRSYQFDTTHLVSAEGFGAYFKDYVLNAKRRDALRAPSPWSESVLGAMFLIVRLGHATSVSFRTSLYGELFTSIEEAIKEESGTGKGLAI